MDILISRHGKTGRNITSEAKRVGATPEEDKLMEKYDGIADDDITITDEAREQGTPEQGRFLAWWLDQHNIEPHEVQIVSGMATRHRQTRDLALQEMANEGFAIPPKNIQEFYFLNELDKGPVRDMYYANEPPDRDVIDVQTHVERLRKQPEHMVDMPYPYGGDSLANSLASTKIPLAGLVEHAEEESAKVLIMFGSAMRSQVITTILTNKDPDWLAGEKYLGNNAVRHLKGSGDKGFEDKGIIHGEQSKVMDVLKEQEAELIR